MQVSRDIEDPYHYDPNELPLPQIQYKLNERLLAVSHARRPVAFTDVGELSGPGNTVVLSDEVQCSPKYSHFLPGPGLAWMLQHAAPRFSYPNTLPLFV